MALYQINISYDGTDFYGYQRQTDRRTIQGEIELALKKIGWKDDSIISSGRTDAGVHADGQVARFDLEWKHSENQLRKALNANLPADISINSLRQVVDKEFHPRFDAKTRVYRYQIYLSEHRYPLLDRFHWQIWPEPEESLIHTATQEFIGFKDFRAFGRPYQSGGRTVRIIHKAEWIKKGDSPVRLDFRIEGNSFLYHMVRRLVFILIKVGQGRISISHVIDAFEGNDNLPAGIAPAKGLFLEKINY